MDSPKLRRILEQIGHKENKTAEEIRKEIVTIMEEGQRNPDPTVQAAWAAIPRQGEHLTVEEFVTYLIQATQ